MGRLRYFYDGVEITDEVRRYQRRPLWRRFLVRLVRVITGRVR